jgi:hypothetical protein
MLKENPAGDALPGFLLPGDNTGWQFTVGSRQLAVKS